MYKSKLLLILFLLVSQNCLTSDYDSDSSRSNDWEDATPYGVKIVLEKTLPAFCPKAKRFAITSKRETILVCFMTPKQADEFKKRVNSTNYKILPYDEKIAFYKSLALTPPSSSRLDHIGLPDNILVKEC